jgi:hypothetical protein
VLSRLPASVSAGAFARFARALYPLFSDALSTQKNKRVLSYCWTDRPGDFARTVVHSSSEPARLSLAPTPPGGALRSAAAAAAAAEQQAPVLKSRASPARVEAIQTVSSPGPQPGPPSKYTPTRDLSQVGIIIIEFSALL